jgi:putative FmdB family regulatory protein
MPIYEYICKDCKREFEELVFSQDELPPCPKCRSTKVEKLMSACTVKTESSGGDTSDFGAMPPMGGGCGSGGG